MLLNESPSGAGIVPMHCTIRQVLRRSIRLIANAIPLPMILRRSFRFPNDRFGFNYYYTILFIQSKSPRIRKAKRTI